MDWKKESNEEDYFLSPKIDFLFKRIFADERTTKPICSLLSAVLNEEVTEVRILNPEIPRSIADMKGNVLDIRAVLGGKTHVNIEMQIWNQIHYMRRTQYNLARLYEVQIESGDDYSKLERTIAINFLSSGSYKLPKEKWHTKYIFKEIDLNTPMPDGMLEMHFIELEKMLKCKVIDESNLLVKWGLFMTAESMQEMQGVAKHDPAILEALSIVEEVAKNKEERRLYEARQAFIRDMVTNQKEYERREKRAREEGIEIGEKRGREEAVLQTAKAMLVRGIPIEEVCTITGLTPEDLT